jgi:hypothetical protein
MHRLAALRAGRRRRVFGHGMFPGSGGSTTELSVTDCCRGRGGDGST